MSLAKCIAPFIAAAVIAAIVFGISASSPRGAHAQPAPPAQYYGTPDTGFAAGDTVDALVDGISCGSATASSLGEWILQIPSTAPCSPSTGDTVTFSRNGFAMQATETWSSGDGPDNILGIDGTLATIAPATFVGTFTAGDAIEGTLDLTTDVKTVDGEEIVETTSADGTITAVIPLAAVVDTVTVAVTINRIADTDVDTTVPTGTFVVAGQTLDIQVRDDQGDEITQFTDDITFTAKVDPVDVDVETVAVFFFDTTLSVWVQIPATVSADGTVEWSVQHLTLFSLLRLSKITVQLNSGLNLITFTGASGTTAADITETLGGPSVIQNLLRFDASTQGFASYVPNAPAIANTLRLLSQRDALFVNVTSATPVQYTSTDIVVSESGSRTVTIVPGLNTISFTGTNETDVAAFLTPLGSSVISASRFKSATQSWDTFAPGAPSFANTLKTLSRLDVIFVNVSGATQFFEIVEVPQ